MSGNFFSNEIEICFKAFVYSPEQIFENSIGGQYLTRNKPNLHQKAIDKRINTKIVNKTVISHKTLSNLKILLNNFVSKQDLLTICFLRKYLKRFRNLIFNKMIKRLFIAVLN